MEETAWNPRKLKGGTAVLLCLKRQFAGLRYGLYITAQLLRMVGDSSVDSELLLFCAKGIHRARIPPALFLFPLAVKSPLLVLCRTRGLLLSHHLAGKCVSCVARCLFVDGTIYSRYSRIQISACRASERARSRELLFCFALRRFLLRFFVPPSSLLLLFLFVLSPSALLSISLFSISSCAPNPLTLFAIATDF